MLVPPLFNSAVDSHFYLDKEKENLHKTQIFSHILQRKTETLHISEGTQDYLALVHILALVLLHTQLLSGVWGAEIMFTDT